MSWVPRLPILKAKIKICRNLVTIIISLQTFVEFSLRHVNEDVHVLAKMVISLPVFIFSLMYLRAFVLLLSHL